MRLMKRIKPIHEGRQVIWRSKQWPHFTVNDLQVKDALLDARRKQGQVLGKANAIGLVAAGELAQEMYIQEVMATSAIEGEPLNPESVRSSVLRKLGVRSPLDQTPKSQHVDGLVEVIQDALENYTEPLTAQRLYQWHRALFSQGTGGFRKITVGQFRTHEDPMQIVSGKFGKEVVHYTAVPSNLVPQEMQLFLEWFEGTRPGKLNKSSAHVFIDGVERAAIAHLWFESIHPFEDGNGRLGRAIVEMAMAQDAQSSVKFYSLADQIMRQRTQYYDALNSAQHGDMDVSDWVIWFANVCALACLTSCEYMNAAIEKSSFWLKHSDIQLNDRQRKVLQRLLDDGDGGFLGGLNAEKYIKITGTSKATATRDLSELTRAGMLFTIGQGKALRYYINIPSWRHGVR